MPANSLQSFLFRNTRNTVGSNATCGSRLRRVGNDSYRPRIRIEEWYFRRFPQLGDRCYAVSQHNERKEQGNDTNSFWERHVFKWVGGDWLPKFTRRKRTAKAEKNLSDSPTRECTPYSKKSIVFKQFYEEFPHHVMA